MNNKGQITLGGIVIIIIAVFVCLALIQAIFNGQAVMTTKRTISSELHNVPATTGRNMSHVNESRVYTLTEAPTGWKITKCPITDFVLKNSSGDLFVDTTDYVLTASSGTYTLVQSEMVNTTLPLADNNTYATYTFCPDGYNVDQGSRSIASLIGLFAALALMAFLVGYALKEWL